MLSIKNISKTYKKSTVKAIDDVSIDIEDGDIYGFVGPNGAGKSTTLKCVVGIHSYDSGEIYLNGKTLKDDPIGYKKMLAYVPDNPDIYEHLTGIQYLDFIANVFGMGEEKNELIHKYSALFGIEDKLANPVKSYSHGMRQKLQIISALIHNPKLLVLDEPFVGLDPKATFDLKEVMKELCAQGTMIFFSSHVLEVVEKFCNKIAIIKDGKIIAQGLTEEVKGDESLEQKFMELFND
ncbi:MAG: ABC transporter ATP-binding protein [Acholeplasmatales bacterium]|nr:ABC transporter ATP-binding protein [Acholeplasmatales bacterium]